MLDINDVTVIGKCVWSSKYVGGNFDGLTLRVDVNGESIKVKSSGDKSKFFGEEEYKGSNILAFGRLKKDSYTSKKMGQVTEYVVDCTPTKLGILSGNEHRPVATARACGKVIGSNDKFIVLNYG